MQHNSLIVGSFGRFVEQVKRCCFLLLHTRELSVRAVRQSRSHRIPMAKIRCVQVLILVSLVISAQCEPDFHILDGLIGTDYLVNNAGDMTIRNMALSGNTPQPDLGDVALPKGRSYDYLVVTGITSVTSWCKMSNATGYYDQQLLSWSNDPARVQPIDCVPDCQWTIDSRGFWVTNSANQLKFVAGWNSGHR